MARTQLFPRVTSHYAFAEHICGCYFYLPSTNRQKHYLPLLESEVRSTILSTTSRNVLTQTYTNPSKNEAIEECIYTFPLYDGVSVVSFTCHTGAKILRGLVKEKVKAKKIFDSAVAKGETAGLLEQAPEASDVFSTKLGNIPAGESVVVEITYIGELKHHDTQGIRFTIPTKIAPRYGAKPDHTPVSSAAQDNDSIRITVDVHMPAGTFIKGVESPSHPIAVSMGTLSDSADSSPLMSRASATLSRGNAALDKDFVLIVHSQEVGAPKAMLEIHPTIPHHRALMATLVPKFSLPPLRPEIVFVADRSGSMAGNISMLASAMNVFLKSLPQVVKFNICSFGSHHSLLWPKSQSYSKETLDQASEHVQSFEANMGGTEIFNAIKATIENRYIDIPLEIILLTDGDIWNQEALFEYLNQQVETSNGNIRVFPLGIGDGVSHALIEGIARAGNGFAQAVQSGERLEKSVVRMLRGALSPHITDYTIEVKYEPETDDGFELVEKVTEGMKVLLSDDDWSQQMPPPPQATISLFDTSAEPEKQDLSQLEVKLPLIPLPKLLQAPHKIPSLFAFSRTTVYLLMSPTTVKRNPTAVILRGTSAHGPLALEIPIEVLSAPAETIHQLAARKACQDLEEGRGWLYDAKDQNNVLVKNVYPSCFDDLVKKEAVRLGEKFQVANKWCSFVAVSANNKKIEEKDEKVEGELNASDEDQTFSSMDAGESSPLMKSRRYKRMSTGGMAPRKQVAFKAAYRPTPSIGAFSSSHAMPPSPPVLFGASANNTYGSSASTSQFGGLATPSSASLFTSYQSMPQQQLQQQAPRRGLFGPSVAATSESGVISSTAGRGGSLFGSARGGSQAILVFRQPSRYAPPTTGDVPDYSSNFSSAQMSAFSTASRSAAFGSSNAFSLHAQPHKFDQNLSVETEGNKASDDEATQSLVKIDWSTKSTSDKVLHLIDQQGFAGFWDSSSDILDILGCTADEAQVQKPQGVSELIWTTILVMKFLEMKCADEEGTWGLVVEKAKGWLETESRNNIQDYAALEKAAVSLIQKL